MLVGKDHQEDLVADASPAAQPKGRLGHFTLITPYFWPEVISCVPLMASLAEDLAAAGWDVDVLTSAPASWDDGEKISRHRDKLSLSDSYRGARVFRLANPFSRKPGALWKLLEYIWFSAWICLGVAFRRRSDVIFVYSNPPLLGLGVAWLARLRGTKVLYNLQDLFPDTAVSAGLLRTGGLLHRFLRGFERATYGSVDCVATIGDSFADHVRKRNPGASVVVVPNWVDTTAIRPVPSEENGFVRRYPEIGGKFVVLYSGNLGFLHGLDALVDAAALLRDLPEILFVIVGTGQRRSALEARAAAEGLDNIRFFDFQPFSLVADVYSAGDICLVPMRRGASNTAIPSKIWTIMAAGRPLLAGIERDTDLARLITEESVGCIVEPEDGRALAAEIRRLYAEPDERERLGKSGRSYVETHLSRSEIMARYLTIITGLTDRGGGRRSPHNSVRAG